MPLPSWRFPTDAEARGKDADLVRGKSADERLRMVLEIVALSAALLERSPTRDAQIAAAEREDRAARLRMRDFLRKRMRDARRS